LRTVDFFLRGFRTAGREQKGGKRDSDNTTHRTEV
jgi:hypothetical protein